MKKALGKDKGAAGEGMLAGRLLSLFRRFGKDRSGVFFIIFAISLPVLVGVTGLGIESGMWYLEKRRIQEAVDSGALSGAFEYRSNSSINQAGLETVVTSALTKTGYGGISIDVNRPPDSGPFATGGAQASDTAVEVIGTASYATFFLAAVGLDGITMHARAVAAQSGLSTAACVLALGSTDYGKAAITIAGGAEVELDGCAIHANGVTDPSVDIKGNSKVSAECITGSNSMSADTLANYTGDIPADFDAAGSGVYTNSDCGTPSGSTGTIDDPFADLVAPDETANACSNSFAVAALDPPGGFLTMLAELFGIGTAHAGGGTAYAATPGNYCNLPNFNPNDTVTFAPGVYYVQGGMNIQGGVSGDNVIFIMQGAGADLDVNASAGLALTAPSDTYIAANPALFAGLTDDASTGASAWAGMLLYNGTSGTNSCSTLNGDSASSFGGIIYMPDACMSFSGSSSNTSPTDCLQIVVNQLSISGDAGLTTAGCGAYGAKEFLSSSSVGLVE